MDYLRILWDDPDDPQGNVWHVEEHGLSIDDVEDVIGSPISEGISESSGRPCVWGYTIEGLYIIVVYDEIDEHTIRVVTAYEVPEPRSVRHMGKKLQRVFRDRPLRAEEAAVDREVRQKVQEEFPPSRHSTDAPPSPLRELLQKSIRESGKSIDVIAGESGVRPELIASFLAGERDIHLTTADKLARSLGLEVTAD